MSNRLRVRVDDLAPETLVVTDDRAHHLARVVRVEPGDAITAFDGAGHERACVVHAVEAHGRTVRVTLRATGAVHEGVRGDAAGVVLLQGVARGDRFDEVIDAATQLGVRAIVPVRCARSVVRGEMSATKRERQAQIAASAAQQCGRADVPEVRATVTLAEALGAIGGEISTRIVAWEEGGESVVAALARGSGAGIAVLVGPEGGLTREEVDLAVGHGFTVVTLGPRILRTELAGITVLAVASAVRGDLARG